MRRVAWLRSPRLVLLGFVRRFVAIVGDDRAEACEVIAVQLRPPDRRMDDGIGRHAVLLQLEMDVRAGRAAGAADEADQLAAFDPDAFGDARREGREMAIDGLEVAFVL